ncbi:glycosyltransferase family 2 protein [Kitasatospora purpeofusca]|uniref:glycosyltransferase family 2 protein n=1 Tax=Kitasatospora purpeofusca TaxID=67352 RepID=UPI002A5AD35E|nr:glycosyltransferase [Kitasatospora purpeofusca]MDY0814528.1 glycosyltransferase [Kitasatospora purpeofusca]
MENPSAAAPRIGVVVITRNRRERLLHTLDRLRSLPEAPPVLVLDNASADGTAAAVRDRHPWAAVRVLRRNRGAVARNLGVEALGTPYVAFSDDDSWWRPGALSLAAGLFDRHQRLGLLAAATLVGPGGRADPIDDRLATSPLGMAPDLPGPSVLGFLACASIVRRTAFLQVGGFHPVLHFGGEECLLALDLAAAGWGVAHCPQVVAHHHPDPGPRPGRLVRVRRNELLTCWLRRPWSHVARQSACLVREAAGDRQAARALAGALPRIPAALALRRPLPPELERSVVRLEEAGAADREAR